MNKKVAILGKLETKYNAPFDRSDWDIWSFNKHEDEEFIPRVDKWFDIHKYEDFVDKKDADIKFEDFPFSECHELVGGEYYCSTMAYLIAYAILEGYEKIYLYGSRFTDDGNPRRSRERANVREMVMFARGRGIEILAPEDKDYLLTEYHIKEGKEFDQ